MRVGTPHRLAVFEKVVVAIAEQYGELASTCKDP